MPDRASLIESRKLVLDKGAIIQIRIWRLPRATRERPHGLKYSLFYGRHSERVIGTTMKVAKVTTGIIGTEKNVISSSASSG